MKAITKYQYGGPEVLQLEEIDKPVAVENELLVNVKANSANPADWHILRGSPFFARFTFGLFKPTDKVLGADFAGVVTAVGPEVKNFKVGDRVYGESLQGGAFAEYLNVPESVCGQMPENSNYKEMACIPIAGLTALQAIVNHGNIKQGETVLINGASGGVGHFAVQIAKALGATVTGVCSSKNADFVRSIGADHVISYDKNIIHGHQGKYDVVIDTNGNLNHDDYLRMGKRGVMIGFTTMGQMMTVMLKRALNKFPIAQFTAEAHQKDLETLAEMVSKGQIKPHIEKTYPASEIPKAVGYIEAMRTRGKVSMVWE